MVPPQIINISSDITINEGSSVTLLCLAFGRPEPTVTWKHLSSKAGQRKVVQSDEIAFGAVAMHHLSVLTSSSPWREGNDWKISALRKHTDLIRQPPPRDILDCTFSNLFLVALLPEFKMFSKRLEFSLLYSVLKELCSSSSILFPTYQSPGLQQKEVSL
ncbi:hypothetical protein L345_05971, partial [Ophiophagus hannah]